MSTIQNTDIPETTKDALKFTKELKNQIGEMRDTLNKMLASKKDGSSNVFFA